MKQAVSAEKQQFRILEFLSKHANAELLLFNGGQKADAILKAGGSSQILCSRSVIDDLVMCGDVGINKQICKITRAGEMRLKRKKAVKLGCPDGGFAAQHRELVSAKVRLNELQETVTVNTNESPLHRLRYRKSKNGTSWISEEAFQAGERLRGDFTRGHLMQKVSSNWDFSSVGSRTSGTPGGKVNVSDNAIDARKRVQSAFEFVGPELAGLLTDVCCYLKGLETVERDRKWPPRSAKLMLRTALDLLARYYGTISGWSRGSKPAAL